MGGTSEGFSAHDYRMDRYIAQLHSGLLAEGAEQFLRVFGADGIGGATLHFSRTGRTVPSFSSAERSGDGAGRGLVLLAFGKWLVNAEGFLRVLRGVEHKRKTMADTPNEKTVAGKCPGPQLASHPCLSPILDVVAGIVRIPGYRRKLRLT